MLLWLMLLVLSNGFIPIIPVLLWNALLVKRLPEAYGSDAFDRDIPKIVLMLENVLRMLVFLLPLCAMLNIKTSTGQIGFIIYLFGMIIYFGSWILLIKYPTTKWCKSVFGFTAPAYTPLIWLVGLSLMIDSFYFNFPFVFWYYAAPSCIFIIVHLAHSILAFRKL